MANPNIPVASLARLFNLSERRIQQMAREGIIPKPEKGKYDFLGCTRAYIKYLQERPGSAHDHQDAYLERGRLLKAQADKTEIEVKVLRGEYVARDEIDLELSGLVLAMRASLLALPQRCALRVMNLKTYPEVENCLREQVYEVLNGVSHYDPARDSESDHPESGELSRAAAELESERMGEPVPPAE